jgi:carbon-monoxide dehydrogenase medium subunit
MRDGFWADRYLVDVKPLPGMRDINFDEDAGLRVGAAVSMNRVIADANVQRWYPMLAEAANTVASYQLRSRATIVGNICNASPAGDTTGACIVYHGVLKVHGIDGWRDESLSGFFLGPGKTVLNPGDIVTEIRLPLPPPGSAGRYLKLGRNKVGDLAIVGVAVLAYPDRSAASGYRFRIALASVGPTPVVPAEAEAILANKPFSEAVANEAAEAAMHAVKPIDDTRGGAKYRSLMVRNLVRLAVNGVGERVNLDI